MTWLATHHAQLVYLASGALALLNAAIKLALWLHPVSDWVSIAERKPRVAALVRLMSAIGINPVSVLQSMVDLIRGQASPGTIASAKAYAVSASKPLIVPSKEKSS
jgi:hypothetical protein